MPMNNRGLTKLIEECGEVIQVAAKLLAYPDGDHPDGQGNLYRRLEDELADVAAASNFVADRLPLDRPKMDRRAATKLRMFQTWEADPDS